MATNLILLENVEDLGIVGDSVRVAEGYARNFLLPRNLAVPSTQASLRQIEVRKENALKEHKANLVLAQGMAEKLTELSVVTVMANASDEDKLFGSVTNVEIATALAENGYEINRRDILLTEPIKNLGLSEFKVKLHAEVFVDLRVLVSKA